MHGFSLAHSLTSLRVLADECGDELQAGYRRRSQVHHLELGKPPRQGLRAQQDMSTTTLQDMSTSTLQDMSTSTLQDMSTTTLQDMSTTTLQDIGL